jgi:hypothetical protein
VSDVSYIQQYVLLFTELKKIIKTHRLNESALQILQNICTSKGSSPMTSPSQSIELFGVALLLLTIWLACLQYRFGTAPFTNVTRMPATGSQSPSAYRKKAAIFAAAGPGMRLRSLTKRRGRTNCCGVL